MARRCSKSQEAPSVVSHPVSADSNPRAAFNDRAHATTRVAFRKIPVEPVTERAGVDDPGNWTLVQEAAQHRLSLPPFSTAVWNGCEVAAPWCSCARGTLGSRTIRGHEGTRAEWNGFSIPHPLSRVRERFPTPSGLVMLDCVAATFHGGGERLRSLLGALKRSGPVSGVSFGRVSVSWSIAGVRNVREYRRR